MWRVLVRPIFLLLQRKRTLRSSKETGRLRPNGLRESRSSTDLTPESYTLSVDTLPRREMYPSDSTWRIAMDLRPQNNFVGGSTTGNNGGGGWIRPRTLSPQPPPLPPHRTTSTIEMSNTLVSDLVGKSPSSSDSSRKRKLRTKVICSPPRWDSTNDDPPSASLSLHISRSDHDLSSPEYPSLDSSGHQRIPKPPPPPRLYWQNQQSRHRRNYTTDDSDV